MRRAVGVWVVAGLAFLSGCEAPVEPGRSGSLVVSNVTSGGALDVDGFAVTVWGDRRPFNMDLDQKLVLADLAPDDYRISLTGIAANCRVEGGPARTVQVNANASTEVIFTVTCEAPAELASLRVAFVAGSRGVVALRGDGSGAVELGNRTVGAAESDVSVDGTRLTFTRSAAGADGPGLFVMNVDGSGLRPVAPGFFHYPKWSPDGRTIAFSDADGLWGGAIHVVGADGGPVRSVTGPTPPPEDAMPTWSPDGRRIAFARNMNVDGVGLWAVDTDGTGLSLLFLGHSGIGPLGEMLFPVWSPDGQWMAFLSVTMYGTTGGLEIASTDSQGVQTLLRGDYRPHDWSPDGKMLLLTKVVGRPGAPRSDVYLFRVADRQLFRLTAGGYSDSPAFWPDPITPR